VNNPLPLCAHHPDRPHLLFHTPTRRSHPVRELSVAGQGSARGQGTGGNPGPAVWRIGRNLRQLFFKDACFCRRPYGAFGLHSSPEVCSSALSDASIASRGVYTHTHTHRQTHTNSRGDACQEAKVARAQRATRGCCNACHGGGAGHARLGRRRARETFLHSHCYSGPASDQVTTRTRADVVKCCCPLHPPACTHTGTRKRSICLPPPRSMTGTRKGGTQAAARWADEVVVFGQVPVHNFPPARCARAQA